MDYPGTSGMIKLEPPRVINASQPCFTRDVKRQDYLGCSCTSSGDMRSNAQYWFKKLIEFNLVGLLTVKTPPKAISSYPMRLATFKKDIYKRGCVGIREAILTGFGFNLPR